MFAATMITVSSGEVTAIIIGLLTVAVLQLWALVETAARRRWAWLAAIWLLFPLGTLGWLTVRRWRGLAIDG